MVLGLSKIKCVLAIWAFSFDKDHADDPMSFVPIFHSESTRINNLPTTRRTSPEEEERIQQAT
jgi:hypothetical protein